jgi:hypothetical protein
LYHIQTKVDFCIVVVPTTIKFVIAQFQMLAFGVLRNSLCLPHSDIAQFKIIIILYSLYLSKYVHHTNNLWLERFPLLKIGGGSSNRTSILKIFARYWDVKKEIIVVFLGESWIPFSLLTNYRSTHVQRLHEKNLCSFLKISFHCTFCMCSSLSLFPLLTSSPLT